MEVYQKEIEIIKNILKENPKGMTVTDIAREIKINRNSVAKYLDVMRISGHVEMITFGPAKVFFPSRRIPISIMINHVSDYIIILDKDQRLIQINDTFLRFINKKRDTLIEQTIQSIKLPFINSPEIQSNITKTLNGEASIKEIHYQTNDPEYYFIIKLIPTVLEDGRHVATIIIKNITDQKIAENKLKKLQK